MSILIPISIGELWDKYSILLIKKERVKDETKLTFIEKEIEYLKPYMTISPLFIELKKINEHLWEIEDKIRIKEYKKEFDSEFIELARSVYITNDKRADTKKEINIQQKSIIHEIKDYIKYS
jgi:hypothetical protein